MPANVVTEEQWDRSSSAAPAIGLTKREHFAGLAMNGILSNSLLIEELADMVEGASILKPVSVLSNKYADALLKELENES